MCAEQAEEAGGEGGEGQGQEIQGVQVLSHERPLTSEGFRVKKQTHRLASFICKKIQQIQLF